MWQAGSDVTSDTEAQGGVSKRSLCVHVCVLNYAGPYRYSANDISLCLYIQCYVAHMYYHCCTSTAGAAEQLLFGKAIVWKDWTHSWGFVTLSLQAGNMQDSRGKG